jgi:alpha-tubulin suppressor-like RCC1 family protein
MALLNTGCSVSTIQADITGLTTGYAAECFAILAGAVDGATSDRCVAVPNSGCLPNLYPTQRVPDGQILFVEDVGVPVVAAAGKWIGFDKRTFRNDCPTKELLTWGNNDCGQLGDSSLTSRSSPGSVSGGGSTWRSISSGYSYSAAIKTDGTLWTWGRGGYNQLGIAGGTRSSPGTTAGGGTDWCVVSARNAHTAAVKTDGTLWTWGSNTTGQLGDGTTTQRVSPGTVAGGANNWSQVSVGRTHTAAIKNDGSLWTWGCNASGQLGDATTTSRSSPGTVAGGGTTWCFIYSGCASTFAIKTDGTLWSWGANGSGELGNATTTARSSPGTTAGGGTTWCLVSAGCLHALGIKTDGTLWGWGFNIGGVVGNGSSGSFVTSPVTTAGGGTTWCGASAGCLFSAAVKTDGTLWTWGYNTQGRLGDGTTTNRSSPGTVAGGITTWGSVAAGYNHATALKLSFL